jgi:hypothetical protein
MKVMNTQPPRSASRVSCSLSAGAHIRLIVAEFERLGKNTWHFVSVSRQQSEGAIGWPFHEE